MAEEIEASGILNEVSKRSRKERPTITVQGARLPPNATEIEDLVLGALLIEPTLIGELKDYLMPAHFYDPKNAEIYEAIQKLANRNSVVDTTTVVQYLAEAETLGKVGGARRIASLSLAISSAASAAGHVKIIIQKYLQREVIRLCSETQMKAYEADEDVDELVEEMEGKLFELSEYKLQRDVLSMELAVRQTMDELTELKEHPDMYSGVPTGFYKLDLITQGFQKGDLVVLAARPSMGKTALAMTMAMSMSLDKKKSVAFFSLEMPTVALVRRLLSAEAKVDSKVLRSGLMREEEEMALWQAASRLMNASIYLDDSQNMGVGEIQAKCRRLKQQKGIDIVFIDYLQLISTPATKNGSREQEVSKISRGLKAMAKELNIPVVALAQLSRAIEGRDSKTRRPILSDLRESGSIEQDADIVMFIHRPEKYGILEFKDHVLTEGKAELIIAKHRNGETGSAFVDFDSHNARFVDTRDLVDHNYEGNENEKKSNSDQKRAAYANPPISEEEQGEETHDIQSRSNDELEYGDDREQPAF